MPASFPASMLNQNRSDLGIPNRFIPNPSRSRTPNAISAVLTAVSTGDLTPAEASDVTRLLDAYVRRLNAELDQRVERLEKAVTGGHR
jgi:hypothetical protein